MDIRTLTLTTTDMELLIPTLDNHLILITRDTLQWYMMSKLFMLCFQEYYVFICRVILQWQEPQLLFLLLMKEVVVTEHQVI